MNDTNERPRRRRVIGALVLAGAVAGVVLLVARHSAAPSTSSRASLKAAGLGFDAARSCPAVRERIRDKRTFDAKTAAACAKADADPQRTGRPTQIGETCGLINARAATGDLGMPLTNLLDCRALDARARSSSPGHQDTPSSVCTGVGKLLHQGETVDETLAKICDREPPSED